MGWPGLCWHLLQYTALYFTMYILHAGTIHWCTVYCWQYMYNIELRGPLSTHGDLNLHKPRTAGCYHGEKLILYVHILTHQPSWLAYCTNIIINNLCTVLLQNEISCIYRTRSGTIISCLLCTLPTTRFIT